MKLAEGVAQTIVIVVGTVIALVIVGGLTYAFLTDQLPLVFVIAAAIIIAAIVIHLVGRARSKAKASRPKTGQKRLKHVVTVSLDTELEPFDHHSEWFEEGDVIEVDAWSKEGASFHFMVCDDDTLRINERRSVNFEYDEGKKFTTRFKKRFEIPESGMWHFLAHTPQGEKYTTVTLTISKLE